MINVQCFVKWLFCYYVFGALSAFISHVIETSGDLSEYWWVLLLMLPITSVLTFILAIDPFYSGFYIFLLVVGSFIFLGSTIAFVTKRADIWLFGVSLGSAVGNWLSVTGFFTLMPV